MSYPLNERQNWLRVKDSNLRPLGYEPNSLTTDVTRYIWYKWPESNRHARYRRQILSLLWLPITPHLHGIPQETRTLTGGFGDRRAAITLGRNIWYAERDSNP